MKDSDIPTRAVLAVNKYTRNNPPRREADEGEALDAYENAHAVSREAIMLELRLKTGEIVSFPYSSLRMARYSPQGTVELRFDGNRVTAEGTNLRLLHDSIIQHRQRFIQEGTDAEKGAKSDDTAHIDRIVITEESEEL
jgi:hypothetical protein